MVNRQLKSSALQKHQTHINFKRCSTSCLRLTTQALYKGLEELSAKMSIELELHVNEAPFTRSFMLSDRELAQVRESKMPAVV